MARLILDGMTMEQAIELANYYEGHGEQVADEWMMEHGLRAPLTCMGDSWLKIDKENQEVILKVK